MKLRFYVTLVALAFILIGYAYEIIISPTQSPAVTPTQQQDYWSLVGGTPTLTNERATNVARLKTIGAISSTYVVSAQTGLDPTILAEMGVQPTSTSTTSTTTLTQTAKPTATPELFPTINGATFEQMAILCHSFNILKECNPDLEQYVIRTVKRIDVIQGVSSPASALAYDRIITMPADYYFPRPEYIPQMLLHESWHIATGSSDEAGAHDFAAQCPPERYH